MAEVDNSTHQKALTKSQRAFLKAYAKARTITHAAIAVDMERQNHYRWMRESELYRNAFAVADTEVTGDLEDEAVRRATEGVCRPVLHLGEQVVINGEPLYEWDKSDTLLIFLLKGRKPGMYRDRASFEHSGPGGVPLLTLADLDRIVQKPDGE